MEQVKEIIAFFADEGLANECKDQFDCLLDKLGHISVADFINVMYGVLISKKPENIMKMSSMTIDISYRWSLHKNTSITFENPCCMSYDASIYGWIIPNNDLTWEPAEVVPVLTDNDTKKYELAVPKPVLLTSVVKSQLNSIYGAKGVAPMPTDYECNDQMVSHPPHYQSKSGMEVADVIEAFTEDLIGAEATHTGNIIKYACRWKHKNGIQDLKKILWYTQRLINYLEKEGKTE